MERQRLSVVNRPPPPPRGMALAAGRSPLELVRNSSFGARKQGTFRTRTVSTATNIDTEQIHPDAMVSLARFLGNEDQQAIQFCLIHTQGLPRQTALAGRSKSNYLGRLGKRLLPRWGSVADPFPEAA